MTKREAQVVLRAIRTAAAWIDQELGILHDLEDTEAIDGAEAALAGLMAATNIVQGGAGETVHQVGCISVFGPGKCNCKAGLS